MVSLISHSVIAGARFVKVDGGKHRLVGPIYGIYDFPTIRIFINGRMQDDYSGRRVASDIRAAADKLVQETNEASLKNHEITVRCMFLLRNKHLCHMQPWISYFSGFLTGETAVFNFIR